MSSLPEWARKLYFTALAGAANALVEHTESLERAVLYVNNLKGSIDWHLLRPDELRQYESDSSDMVFVGAVRDYAERGVPGYLRVILLDKYEGGIGFRVATNQVLAEASSSVRAAEVLERAIPEASRQARALMKAGEPLEQIVAYVDPTGAITVLAEAQMKAVFIPQWRDMGLRGLLESFQEVLRLSPPADHLRYLLDFEDTSSCHGRVIEAATAKLHECIETLQ